MLAIEENVSLLPYNSFGVAAMASSFFHLKDIGQFNELMNMPVFNGPRLILGGGSNILFTTHYPGLIIRNELQGIHILEETASRILVSVASGESWHDFVMHCVDRDWGGLENLSLIPGTVGAAPIQNIGAYGVEISHAIHEVHGIDLSTGREVAYSRDECGFGYRESVFKGRLKEKIFVSSVTLSLTKNNHHFNVHYGAIEEMLRKDGRHMLSVRAISDAVIKIRQSKLPDHHTLGNAGSFFKNPTVHASRAEAIKKEFSEMPSYPSDNHDVKIPAAWLIEQCGWKGKRINHVGVHAHQALVLVNYGGGTGVEILTLSQQIQQSVSEKFSIDLVPEVNII
jgi:UDP-N-acetylmuramate dehydrogenase